LPLGTVILENGNIVLESKVQADVVKTFPNNKKRKMIGSKIVNYIREVIEELEDFQINIDLFGTINIRKDCKNTQDLLNSVKKVIDIKRVVENLSIDEVIKRMDILSLIELDYLIPVEIRKVGNSYVVTIPMELLKSIANEEYIKDVYPDIWKSLVDSVRSLAEYLEKLEKKI